MSHQSAAMRPCLGRFSTSRSPPEPKTQIMRPLMRARRGGKTVWKEEGVWA